MHVLVEQIFDEHAQRGKDTFLVPTVLYADAGDVHLPDLKTVSPACSLAAFAARARKGLLLQMQR